MVDPLVVGCGSAIAGAAVNQLFTIWRDSRARRNDDLANQIGELRGDMKTLSSELANVREDVAGIAGVVNGLVVAPRDDRPRRGR